MNKTALKFFLSCAAVAAVTALILLLLNLAGLLYISYDNDTAATRSSKRVIDLMHSAYESGEDASVLLPEGYWCILLDDGGDVIWSADMPDDIPQHYTLRDVAVLSRWFLCDYPVYTQAEDCGLFILGQPKNAVGKYQIVLSMSWFNSLPARIALVLTLNAALALGLSLLTGRRLYRGVRTLTDGIGSLSREEPLELRGGGIFRPAYQELNKCSAALREKSRALEERDTARRNWVNGISHDIRTPLAVIMGNAEAIAAANAIPEQALESAGRIILQAGRAGRLVDDLNLISTLDSDMQPQRRKPARLCPIIRAAVTDVINSGLAEGREIQPELRDESAVILCDSELIARAVFNLISNAMQHNGEGCTVEIEEYIDGNSACIRIADNGSGIDEAVLEGLGTIPDGTHGLGLPLAYRIITAHGGMMAVRNENGLRIDIAFPLYTE